MPEALLESKGQLWLLRKAEKVCTNYDRASEVVVLATVARQLIVQAPVSCHRACDYD